MTVTPVFAIDETDAMKLMDQGNASEIGAFLVVACHTDRQGRYSSAGAYAVRNALAIGDRAAAKLLSSLEEMGFIKSPDHMHPSSNAFKAIPKREGRAKVRWVLKTEGSRIWLPVSIVQGCGKWKKPLRDLIRCGPDAARLLLAMYYLEDMGSYGGVNPLEGVRCNYDTEVLGGYDGTHFFHGMHDNQFAMATLYRELLGMKEDENGFIPQLWNALASLEKRGFIYQVVTVFTGSELSDETTLLYPLYTYNRHGHPAKGEESLASATEQCVKQHTGKTCADGEGRFYKKFAFIADTPEAQLVGIYRLRFRNTNPKFEQTREAWSNIQAARIYWKERCRV